MRKVLGKFVSIYNNIEKYYTEKVNTYGAVPKGVDWNSTEAQELRFCQLLKVCNVTKPFSLNDYGCGYAYLYEFMSKRAWDFQYYGYDLSKLMISKAKENYGHNKNCILEVGNQIEIKADYSIASGIFNVKLNSDKASWYEYITDTLQHLNTVSEKGFAFNCLTIYSDKDRMREELYYADPAQIFHYCKSHFSRNVALLHDYDLYEFTILVRKAVD